MENKQESKVIWLNSEEQFYILSVLRNISHDNENVELMRLKIISKINN